MAWGRGTEGDRVLNRKPHGIRIPPGFWRRGTRRDLVAVTVLPRPALQGSRVWPSESLMQKSPFSAEPGLIPHLSLLPAKLLTRPSGSRWAVPRGHPESLLQFTLEAASLGVTCRDPASRPPALALVWWDQALLWGHGHQSPQAQTAALTLARGGSRAPPSL